MLSTPHFLDPMRAIAARVKPWASLLVVERAIVLALAATAAVAHAFNMFNYPSWAASNQEGSTVYRAWALLQSRELWGDALAHAPASTVPLAAWLAATGGPQGFGSAVDGGRMLMLVLHVAMVPLLFGLARFLGCGIMSAGLATLLFSLSPLVITQQRLVVPDNFVSFWALLSIYLVLTSGGSWRRKAGAAACIALAFLSSDAAGGPSTPVGSGPPLLQLLALLREPFLALGVAAVVANLVRGLRDPRAVLVGLAGVVPLAGIAIDGSAWNPAFQLAIPFSLNVGVAVAPALDRVPVALGSTITAVAAALFVGQYGFTGALQSLYLDRPAAAEREALAWTRAHIPAQSTIGAHLWAWPGLRDPAFDGIALTAVRLQNQPAASAPEYTLVASDLSVARGYDARAASARGGLVKRWLSDGTEVELRKTAGPGPTEDLLLAGSAQYLSRRFERSGAYAALDGTVTSQDQALAMLRAVWSDDREAFTRAWRWTSQNLSTADGLLASVWRNGAQASTDTASDADADVALALLMAARRWTDEELLVAGRRMVAAVWRREIVLVNGVPHMVAGDWARESPILAVSPGGFAPYAYEVFAAVDADHDWSGVIDSGYRVLFASSAREAAAGSVGLPPDWVGIDRSTGTIAALPLAGRDVIRHSDDAARAYWRVALHHRWSGDARADRFLRSATFLRDETARRGVPARAYALNGATLDAYPSSATTAAALAVLLTLDPPTAHDLYASQLVGAANRLGAGVYWGDLNDVRGQEWAWLTIALYADRVPDLYRGRSPRPVGGTR